MSSDSSIAPTLDLQELLDRQKDALSSIVELREQLSSVPEELTHQIEEAMAQVPSTTQEAKRCVMMMKDIEARVQKLQAASKKLEARKKAALEEDLRNEEKIRAKEAK